MSEVITDSISTVLDPTPLTHEELVGLAKDKSPIIYYNAGKVSVALLKKVKADTAEISRQGVRKGEETYKAGATIPLPREGFVPVLALIDVALLDKLDISYTSLEMGRAAMVEEPTEVEPIAEPNPIETVEEAVGEVSSPLTTALPVVDNGGLVTPLEPGIAADGGLVSFDPEVHVVP